MTDPEPISFDKFLSVLHASNLLPDGFAEALRAFQSHAPQERDEVLAPGFCDYLVHRNILTRWQCDRLLEGRHVGFYVDQYQVLSFVRIEETHTVYLAEDTVTKHQVHVLSTPPPCSPDGKGHIRIVEIN